MIFYHNNVTLKEDYKRFHKNKRLIGNISSTIIIMLKNPSFYFNSKNFEILCNCLAFLNKLALTEIKIYEKQ